jgi:hypothetical protein
MNDNTKTVTFVGVALAALLIAWFSRPKLLETGPEEMVGQLLVADFDPLSAASIEILKFDPDTSAVRPFSVKQVNGLWSIPSHDNYPADAENHLAEAASGLMGRKILSVASESPGDHETFSVVDPDPENPRAGMGTRVTIKDRNDKSLLAMIIGVEVPGRPELRYVRRVGQDPVYTAAVKTDKLSTKFEDWIEKDLLRMKSKEIKQIEIRDHAVDVAKRRLEQRGHMTLQYNSSSDPRWKLARDEIFGPNGWRPQKIAEDEELNTSKLDDLKYALDDLKIVDIHPKPKGLSANLKAGKEFLNSEQAVRSLTMCGFYLADVGEGEQLYSNEGEVRILREDGVEYILRFGQIAGGGEKSEKAKAGEAPKKKDGEAEKPEGSGLNRVIFVTTQFNDAAIAKPELEALPKEEPAAKPDAKPDAKPAAKPDAPKTDVKAEQERIKKENQRKLDQYKEKTAEGKKQVEALNARFADWYYIIPDSVYRKTHLSRTDVVKKKEKKEDAEKPGGKPAKPGDTPADFEHLKEHGPKAEPPATKPADPATKPAEPAAKPGEPAAKPVEPAPKPVDPAAKPAEPAAKPPEPAPKPAEPAAKP